MRMVKRNNVAVILAAGAIVLVCSLPAEAATWTSAPGGTQQWLTSTNWSGGVVANNIGDVADLTSNTGSNAQVVTITTSPVTVGSINLSQNGTGARTVAIVTGGTLTLNNGASDPTVTSTNSASSTGGSSFTAGVIIGSSGSSAALQLVNNSTTSNLALSGSITQATGVTGSVVKSGAGLVSLSGNALSFTGGYSLTNGQLNLGAANVASFTTRGDMNINGGANNVVLGLSGGGVSTTGNINISNLGVGSVSLANVQSTNSATFGGTILIGKAITFRSDVTNGSSLTTIGGTLQDNGLNKGTLSVTAAADNSPIRFTGSSTAFTGAWVFDRGVITLVRNPGNNSVGVGGSTIGGGSNPVSVSLTTLNNQFSDTGAIEVKTNGTLGMTVQSDTVGAVTLSGGAITGTTGVLTGSSYAMQSGTVSAILAGTTSTLTKTTGGTTTLLNANTYRGITTISAGVLALNAGSLATTKIAIDGGTLQGDVTNKGTLNYLLAGDAVDTISITGGTLALSDLNLNLVVSGTQTLGEYVIADQVVGSSFITGTMFNSVSNLPTGAFVDYDGTVANPNSIVVVVPEPVSIGLLGLSALMLRRRR